MVFGWDTAVMSTSGGLWVVAARGSCVIGRMGRNFGGMADVLAKDCRRGRNSARTGREGMGAANPPFGRAGKRLCGASGGPNSRSGGLGLKFCMILETRAAIGVFF